MSTAYGPLSGTSTYAYTPTSSPSISPYSATSSSSPSYSSPSSSTSYLSASSYLSPSSSITPSSSYSSSTSTTPSAAWSSVWSTFVPGGDSDSLSSTSSVTSTITDSDGFLNATRGQFPGWAFGLIALIIVVLCGLAGYVLVWRIRRKRRREAAGGEGGGEGAGDMRELHRAGVPGITRSDRLEITPPPLPPRPAPRPRLNDRTSAPLPPLPPIEDGLPRIGHRHRESSSWEDNSEIDVLAMDGSSLARTISGGSTMTGRSLAEGENPFDHPAYTLPAYSRRTTGTGTGTGISSVVPLSDTHSSGRTPLLLHAPRSAEHSHSLSPVSPLSPLVLPRGSHTQVNTAADYFPHSPSSRSSRSGTSSLSRETTIIRHVDSQGGDGMNEMERQGFRVLRGQNQRGREVHLPPTYIELYPGYGDEERNGQSVRRDDSRGYL